MGRFRIYHPPSTGNVGSISSPAGSSVMLNFSERNKADGVMSTETFSLEVLLTQLHTAGQ